MSQHRGYDRGDRSGRSYHEAREYKQAVRDRPQRELNGEYKEETKCKG